MADFYSKYTSEEVENILDRAQILRGELHWNGNGVLYMSVEGLVNGDKVVLFRSVRTHNGRDDQAQQGVRKRSTATWKRPHTENDYTFRLVAVVGKANEYRVLANNRDILALEKAIDALDKKTRMDSGKPRFLNRRCALVIERNGKIISNLMEFTIIRDDDNQLYLSRPRGKFLRVAT